MHTARSALTPREVQVLRLVARGRTNRQIGSQLAITEGTVKSHMHRILRKMRVANRAEAAVAAMGMGRLPQKLERLPQRPVDVDR
jgi:DNA-binding NarL/FixJ family response regulator